MGRTLKTVQVVFDTSSDWLAVEDTACGSCDGNKFDASQTGALIDTRRVQREYGSVAFTALEYADKVCILTTQCVDWHPYLAI